MIGEVHPDVDSIEETNLRHTQYTFVFCQQRYTKILNNEYKKRKSFRIVCLCFFTNVKSLSGVDEHPQAPNSLI